jgi:hypothetical protein
MAFSRDSSMLALAGARQEVGIAQLWDVATGKLVRGFHGHTKSVDCVAISPNGRSLATGSEDKTLRLWEIASGRERKRLIGHEGAVYSVDFSPDGQRFAAMSSDAPIFIWNVCTEASQHLPGAKPADAQWAKLWEQLADPNATTAFQAICDLCALPEASVSFLEEQWKQTRRPGAAEVQQWLTDLDSPQFRVREQANLHLDRDATGHEELLQRAREQTSSPEVRQRLEKILGQVAPERLHRTRMVEVLEKIGTPAAREFLRRLAADSHDPLLSRDAAASLARLASPAINYETNNQ